MKPLTGKNDKAAWKAFTSVVDNFLADRRPKNYYVAFFEPYRELGCNTSLKYSFLIEILTSSQVNVVQ